MDYRGMQIEFERLVQIINPEYITSKKLDSDTIFYFLNAAQDRFIKHNYLEMDNTKNSNENLKKNIDSFKALIITKDLSKGINISDNYQYGKKFLLPKTDGIEFFLYLRSSSKVHGTYLSVPEGSDFWVPNKFITQDDVDGILVSYYNKPILRQPCVLLESVDSSDSYLAVYIDSFTKLTGCECTYIRRPKKISISKTPQSCELSEGVHQERVELAVNIFITEGAYKLSSQKQSK